MRSKRKLIEVVLPLDAISVASARERTVRQGHPSMLHPWWGRRALAPCRAALFAQLVDDPSSHPDRFPTEEAQAQERQRLLQLLEELVKWEGGSDERVLAAAQAEIWNSCGGQPPPVLVPFAGGGSIPLEAQRLGLEACASDSNPLAVLINRALIEFPARFTKGGSKQAAESVKHYGGEMVGLAEQRLVHLYPKVKLPAQEGGGEATVAAWIWARTIPCPNTACGALVPLVPHFVLALLDDREVWAEPIPDPVARRVRFEVKTGEGPAPEGTFDADAKEGHCLVCGEPIEEYWIGECGRGGRLGAQLMAVVAEAGGRRLYLSPDEEQESKATQPAPAGVPEQEIPSYWGLGAFTEYGVTRYRDLFTNRQLAMLQVLSMLVGEERDSVHDDMRDGGAAEAIAVYLALAVDRLLPVHCALAAWDIDQQRLVPALDLPAPQRFWTFAEANPLHEPYGLERALHGVVSVLEQLPSPAAAGHVRQQSASQSVSWQPGALILTDPPHRYSAEQKAADDFFRVWLEYMLTDMTPRPAFEEGMDAEEEVSPSLVISENASLNKLLRLLGQARGAANDHTVAVLWPVMEWLEEAREAGGRVVSSSAPVTVLIGRCLALDFELRGVWPLDMEKLYVNDREKPRWYAHQALVVLRPRSAQARDIGRQDFLAALEQELAGRWAQLERAVQNREQRVEVAKYLGAVVLSRYTAVLEPDGAPMTPQAALQLGRQLAREFSDRLLAGETLQPSVAAPQRVGPAARLVRVTVENYKSLAHCEVALAPLMFLVGPNGAGKSNFLDALRFVAEALRSGSLPQREGTEELPHRNGRVAGHFGVRLELELAGDRRASYLLRVGAHEAAWRVVEELCRVELPSPPGATAEFRVVEGRVTTTLDIEPPLAHAGRPYLPNLSALPAFRPVFEALSTMMIYDPQPERIRKTWPLSSSPNLAADGSNLPAVFARLPAQARQRIEAFLAAIVPGVERVERCELGPVETLQFIQRLSPDQQPQRFYAASMSDGTLRALAILVALRQSGSTQGPRVSLVGIEEPEIAIHPAAAAVLRDALREASRYTQVLVTSHSPDLLDDKAISPEQLLSVVFENGATQIGPIDEASRSALRDRLYTAGELLRFNQLGLERPAEA